MSPRQRLRPYLARTIGPAEDGFDSTRSWLALDWLIRVLRARVAGTAQRSTRPPTRSPPWSRCSTQHPPLRDAAARRGPQTRPTGPAPSSSPVGCGAYGGAGDRLVLRRGRGLGRGAGRGRGPRGRSGAGRRARDEWRCRRDRRRRQAARTAADAGSWRCQAGRPRGAGAGGAYSCADRPSRCWSRCSRPSAWRLRNSRPVSRSLGAPGRWAGRRDAGLLLT